MGVFEKGTALIIETREGEVYDGIVHSETEQCIALCGTVEYPSGRTFTNIMNFYKDMIMTVRVLNCDNVTDKSTCLFINTDTYKRLTNLVNSYILISKVGETYYDAITHLKGQETIGLDAKGGELGRFNKISYLLLSTLDQVYVFDIDKIGRLAFTCGIKEVIQCELIVKVIHDCRPINDCLKFKYHVLMKNIFDTKVADLTVQTRKNPNVKPIPKSLSQCVGHYTNLPEGFIDQIENAKWHIKPMSVTLKEMLAVRCSFLITLRNLLQRVMNSELINATESIYKQVCQSNTKDGYYSK